MHIYISEKYTQDIPTLSPNKSPVVGNPVAPLPVVTLPSTMPPSSKAKGTTVVFPAPVGA